jgi:hypothetical protein
MRSLPDLETQFIEISQRASALAGSGAPDALARRPKPGSWSVAECIAHLNVSVDLYFPIWDRELPQARRDQRTAQGPYRMGFWGKLPEWSLEPPRRFRLSAPAISQQVKTGAVERILPGFLAIDKIKITSPFDARVRYSIWSSFRVTAAHERRHLWQAERAGRSADQSSE